MPTPWGEFAQIDWIHRHTPPDPRVPIGIGDDAAAVAWAGGRDVLITTDMLMEGSCFRVAEAGPYRVGRKAMAVNLSDIAAMAGRPVAAVVSLGLPRDWAAEQVQDLVRGLRSMADEFGVAVVGGDTNTWDGPLTISVTVIGEPTGPGPVRRNGARPGDWLCVTGPLGGSILGHHLDFSPRVREAIALHAATSLRAMIDISDGLAKDAHRICAASGCGAVLVAERIPIRDAARSMNDGRSAVDHALADGEDFELAFAVSAECGTDLIARQPVPGVTLTHIGEFVETGYWLESAGRREPLEPRGYEHLFGTNQNGGCTI